MCINYCSPIWTMIRIARSYLELFRRKEVDGVVAWETRPSGQLVDFLVAKGIPFALVAMRHPKAASIAINEQAAADMAVANLPELGHRRIGYFVRGNTPDFPQSRFSFISRALADARLPSGPEIFQDITIKGWFQRLVIR
jgi:DNA-binding LacI/PurR family transcriptional regulator